MSSSPIQLVCFDLGGVIVRHCRTWTEGIASAGLDLRGATDSPEMSARRKELARLLTVGVLEEDEFYEMMSATTQGLYTPDEIQRVHHCWTQEEYEGVLDVVSALLLSQSVQVGVLSNTNTPHWRLLSDAQRYPAVHLLLNHLPEQRSELVHASHLLKLAKPDPAIYREYQRRAGVCPQEILFLEDLPDNIAAARDAGWQVSPIDHTRETAPQIRAALQQSRLA